MRSCVPSRPRPRAATSARSPSDHDGPRSARRSDPYARPSGGGSTRVVSSLTGKLACAPKTAGGLRCKTGSGGGSGMTQKVRSCPPACGFSSPQETMRKDQKAQVVDELATQLGEALAIYAVDYRGNERATGGRATGPACESRRRELPDREEHARRARTDKSSVEAIKDLVAEGPTALTFVGRCRPGGQGPRQLQPAGQCARDEGRRPRGPDPGRRGCPAARTPPSRDVLTARFAGVVASPLTGLVRGLGAMAPAGIAPAQVRDKKEAEAPSAPARRREALARRQWPRTRRAAAGAGGSPGSRGA